MKKNLDRLVLTLILSLFASPALGAIAPPPTATAAPAAVVSGVEILVSSMTSQAPDQDAVRLDLLQAYLAKHAAEGRLITVAQASQILAAFAYDSGKLAAAQSLSGRIIDPENAKSVAGASGALDITQPTIVGLIGRVVVKT